MPRLLLAALVCAVLLLTGCTGGASPDTAAGASRDSDTDGAPSSGTPTASGSPSARPGPAERLGLRTGWGPSGVQLDRAARATGRLSLPELAGQVIVAGYSGTSAPVDLVRRLHLGGVIAFDDNITSADQIRDANATLREAVDRDWPVFIGVDQEGGIVARISEGVPAVPTFMTAGAAGEPRLTRATMHALGAALVDLGFSVDFAPDADVTSGPADPTIGSRSAGSDPQLVARQVTAAVAGFTEAGVLPVIKHFPGHGSVPADSHETLPVQTRSRKQLRRTDLVPFRRAVAAGAPAVMVAHIDVRAIDPGVPASLSRKVVTGLLRRDLGFHGLVVTDALDMAGVAAGRSSGEVAVAALRAGADVLLMPEDPAAARSGIVAAVRSGELPRRRLRQAAARQIAVLSAGAGGSGSGKTMPHPAAELSAAAITVAAGPCQGRLVGDAVRPVGDPESVAAFTAAARRAGLPLGSGDTVAFTGYGDGPVGGDVAVATDTPYVLGGSTAQVKIATYGATPAAMDALVAVLLGQAPAPGRLPVPVEGVARRGC